jgi:molecular chaperone GrpE
VALSSLFNPRLARRLHISTISDALTMSQHTPFDAPAPERPEDPRGAVLDETAVAPNADEGSAALFEDAMEQLRKAEQEAAAMKDAYLRARADVENIRRQSQAEVAKAHRYGIEKFAEALLPVKDALESALDAPNTTVEALRAGVELTLKQVVAAFEKSQVVEIDPAGEKFDPHLHEAMATVESDQPANTVVRVMQKGYRLNDRVLRPALVLVAKAPGS